MKVIPLRNILINGQHCAALTEVDLDLDEGTVRTLIAQGALARRLAPAPIQTAPARVSRASPRPPPHPPLAPMLTNLTSSEDVPWVEVKITPAEIATQLRLGPDLDAGTTAHLTALLKAARAQVEAQTGLNLRHMMWEAHYDSWPIERPLPLPKRPCNQIQNILYRPPQFKHQFWSFTELPKQWDNTQVWGWTTVIQSSSPMDIALVLPPAEELPLLNDNDPRAVRINFITMNYAELPHPLRQAILMRVGELYDGREEMSAAVKNLISSYRTSGFIA